MSLHIPSPCVFITHRTHASPVRDGGHQYSPQCYLLQLFSLQVVMLQGLLHPFRENLSKEELGMTTKFKRQNRARVVTHLVEHLPCIREALDLMPNTRKIATKQNRLETIHKSVPLHLLAGLTPRSGSKALKSAL